MTTLNLATKVSSLVEMIRCGKNDVYEIDDKLYLFEIDLVPLGVIVWTTFDICTTMGLETWGCKFGVALTVYEAVFQPSVKSKKDLRWIILPCIPEIICPPGKILPQ